MAASQWLEYAAIGAGAVGTIAGLYGAIVAHSAHRKVTALKRLDLRLELRKSANQLQQKTRGLQDLMPLARKSRERVTAMTGQSGALAGWMESFGKDEERLQVLAGKVLPEDKDYAPLETDTLESLLVEVHRLLDETQVLADKYRDSLREDDVQRERRWHETRDVVNRAR